ncbi:TPA: hypothetical protein QDB45_001667 [Burkholderia vietnamiensis]|nr:hypothetical protein [Burkholderia vietnamiensis]
MQDIMNKYPAALNAYPAALNAIEKHDVLTQASTMASAALESVALQSHVDAIDAQIAQAIQVFQQAARLVEQAKTNAGRLFGVVTMVNGMSEDLWAKHHDWCEVKGDARNDIIDMRCEMREAAMRGQFDAANPFVLPQAFVDAREKLEAISDHAKRIKKTLDRFDFDVPTIA